jgi:hypothetical protein
MEILNAKYKSLDDLYNQYADQYQGAKPFPSFYLDEFINEDLLNLVLKEFPDLSNKEVYYDNPNEKKHASKGDKLFGPNTKLLVNYLNSEEFLSFLQKLTGIKEKLVADPYYEGGGFHEIKKGGFLKIHVDFHKHRELKLDRRLNLLIYLNKDWEESYGGHFELWERDMSQSVVKILPVFNRMAMFSTNGDSWHGHPDPVTCPENRSRKSLALYYYSDGRPESEVKRSERNRITTTFAVRKGQDDIKMTFYNSFVNIVNQILPQSLIQFIKKFRNT